MERLDKGLLDFGVLIEPSDIKKLDCLPIPYIDNMGLLMRKDAPLARQDFISPKDLIGIPIIAPASIVNYNSFLKWIGSDFEKLNIVATCNLIYNPSLLIEEGNNYAITLDHLINTSGDSKLCFRPFSPSVNLSSVIVWKKYQVFSKASKKFLDELKNEINKKN